MASLAGAQNSRRGARRAVGDGGSARGHSDHLGAVDGGLGLEGSHRGGDEASSKDHGTHLDGLVWWYRIWCGKTGRKLEAWFGCW